MGRISLDKDVVNETSIFLSRTSIIIILYLVLQSVLPRSNKLPIIICSLLFSTVLNQTKMLQTLKRKIYRYAYEINEVKELQLDKTRNDLVSSVYDLNSYLQNAYKWNNRRRVLFRQMSPLQQKIASPVDYPKKLNTVDKYFDKNNQVISTIVSNAIKKYDIKEYELKLVEGQATANKRNNYFRVVESLCHFARDWPVEPSDEVSPLLEYIKEQCKDLNHEKTIAIVPGSGLGKVSHTLAEMKFSSVHAIEFSWLMVLMNEFLYSKSEKQKLKIYPYLHTYSNHLTLEDQLRPVEISHSISKPLNLEIHNADFTKFKIQEHLNPSETPENLVFVTCFFLDTAENLVEYLQSINSISSTFKGKKKWINLGPLKYGTAAKIELSNDELKTLVKSMGWDIVDEPDPKLLGYLTDKKGLWQGYYDVVMWSVVKK